MAQRGTLSYLIKKFFYLTYTNPKELLKGFLIVLLLTYSLSSFSDLIKLLSELIIKWFFKDFSLSLSVHNYLVILSQLIFALLFLGILFLLYFRERQKYASLDYEIREVSLYDKLIKNIKALVLFVSLPRKNLDVKSFIHEITDEERRNIIIADMKREENWIMPLTLLETLRKRAELKKVVAIYSVGSRDNDGSFKHKEDFETMVRIVLGMNRAIELEGVAVDFFDLGELQRTLLDVIRRLRERFSEKEILIDVTGGNIPISIIGASLTFRRDILISYVSTKDRSVNVYNVELIITEP